METFRVQSKACLLTAMIFLICGCSAAFVKDMKTNIEDIKISSRMQKKQHHELIRTLQPMLDRKEPLSSFRLFLLASAYYEIRDYEKMFRTVGLLEHQIGKGDVAGYGGNLTVYPQILRGYAYLDQGIFDKALKEVSEAIVVLNRDAKNDNTFYRMQLIDISSIAGVASVLTGRIHDADEHLKTIDDVTTVGGILGPEKYIAEARIHMAKKDYRSALAAIRNPKAKVLGLYTAFYDQTFQEIPKYFILVKCLYETGKEEEAKKGYDQLLGHPQIRQIGVLHYLPFGALSSGKDFLIDRYQLRTLPSASILSILADRAKSRKQSALILGNPDLKNPAYDLKYAEKEALSLGKIIPHATVLLRNNARASVTREKGSHYRILHFAAHGIFDPKNPLNSALLLAGNGIDQGLLRAGDLYQLRLNNDLITLSACETALSVISKGDDVIGFTRGFLYAGARSIVSSLWKVDDKATRDLMVGFYKRLPRMEKDKALREAQLMVKKRYPHPFYWAAFQLTGLPK
jgi:tetratricopeptide (TPR) repeat protein